MSNNLPWVKKNIYCYITNSDIKKRKTTFQVLIWCKYPRNWFLTQTNNCMNILLEGYTKVYPFNVSSYCLFRCEALLVQLMMYKTWEASVYALG